MTMTVRIGWGLTLVALFVALGRNFQLQTQITQRDALLAAVADVQRYPDRSVGDNLYPVRQWFYDVATEAECRAKGGSWGPFEMNGRQEYRCEDVGIFQPTPDVTVRDMSGKAVLAQMGGEAPPSATALGVDRAQPDTWRAIRVDTQGRVFCAPPERTEPPQP